MSTTLSMISRQLVLTTVVYQCQSVHSSLVAPSIRGMATSVGRRLALGVVPDEQHAVLLQGGPGRGAGQRGTRGVGHLLAPAVAAPAPVVERARDLVALHRRPAKVAAHVPAVAVEDIDLAVLAAEHDQLLPEGVDGVRLAVAEIADQPQAVPAAGEPRRGGLGLDLPNVVVILGERSDGLEGVCNVILLIYSAANRMLRADSFRSPGDWIRPVTLRRLTSQHVTTAQQDHPCRTDGRRHHASICWWSAPAPAWPRRWRLHERGLTVLIVEKSSYVGGSTARSGGALWLPASPVLGENGAGGHARSAPRSIWTRSWTEPHPSNAPRRSCSTSSRDGRHAAPDHADEAVLGAGLLRLPPGAARRQRRRAHVRVQAVQHVDARANTGRDCAPASWRRRSPCRPPVRTTAG